MTLAPPATPYWLSEHQWEGSKRVHYLGSENRQTILSVVFHEETRSRFSAICIVLCCRSEIYEEKWRRWQLTQDIQQVDSTSHTSRDEDDALSELDCHPPFNDPALPKCVVVFEVLHYEAPKRTEFTPINGKVVLRVTDYLELLGNDYVRILLETERLLTPDTLSVSSRFTHSPKLYTPTDLRPKSASRYNLTPPPKFQITRVIFREVARAKAYTGARRDLLAFGLVCRKWTCSLDLLLWDFQDRGSSHWSTWPPNIHALGRAVAERPVLGLSIRHFSTATFRPSLLGFLNDDDNIPSNPGFTSDVVAVLRTTSNLQYLELHDIDVCQKEVLASALYDLHELHTFALGVPYPAPHTKRGGGIGFVELAHCLARWPALKSMRMFHFRFRPTMMQPATLPLPVCALTELVIINARLSDSELMHLMSPSLTTLERVVFDTIYGVTYACLRTCLDAISHSVTSLRVGNLRTVRWNDGVQEERVLDATIDKMLRLRSLDIGGDVASELMLQRRAKLFTSSIRDRGITMDSPLPVIQSVLGSRSPVSLWASQIKSGLDGPAHFLESAADTRWHNVLDGSSMPTQPETSSGLQSLATLQHESSATTAASFTDFADLRNSPWKRQEVNYRCILMYWTGIETMMDREKLRTFYIIKASEDMQISANGRKLTMVKLRITGCSCCRWRCDLTRNYELQNMGYRGAHVELDGYNVCLRELPGQRSFETSGTLAGIIELGYQMDGFSEHGLTGYSDEEGTGAGFTMQVVERGWLQDRSRRSGSLVDRGTGSFANTEIRDANCDPETLWSSRHPTLRPSAIYGSEPALKSKLQLRPHSHSSRNEEFTTPKTH
ncbi:hypothetical protein BU15DRAFT_61527 [Melanogaster broomeanus]|nr:hypothetical protein BU15DRAFT_61527 [Melanogaster broomeanus]